MSMQMTQGMFLLVKNKPISKKGDSLGAVALFWL